MHRESSWSSVAQCLRRSPRTRTQTPLQIPILTTALTTVPILTTPGGRTVDVVHPLHPVVTEVGTSRDHLPVTGHPPPLHHAPATLSGRLYRHLDTATVTEMSGWPAAFETATGTGRDMTPLPTGAQRRRPHRVLRPREAGTTALAAAHARLHRPSGTVSSTGGAKTRETGGTEMIPEIASALVPGTGIGETRGGKVLIRICTCEFVVCCLMGFACTVCVLLAKLAEFMLCAVSRSGSTI